MAVGCPAWFWSTVHRALLIADFVSRASCLTWWASWTQLLDHILVNLNQHCQLRWLFKNLHHLLLHIVVCCEMTLPGICRSRFSCLWFSMTTWTCSGQRQTRATLKGTNLRGQTPICGFLRVFCGFLRFPARICGFLRKSALPKCFVIWEKARICKNQRKSPKNLRLGSVCPLRFVPSCAP